MNRSVQSFSVRELLTGVNTYWVPMYQRNYAWGEGEINQLIQDVLDYQQNNQAGTKTQPYYIGTLVVYERDECSFEVIDGQQRFTTLTLIAICLGRLPEASHQYDMSWYDKLNLDFESRVKSSNTFSSLKQGVPLHLLKEEDYNSDVVNGFALIEKGLLALGEKLHDFCEYLFNYVEIARVLVPSDTDLNHYFEVMNNRGEQLEKHEVVKARLMSILMDNEDKKLLSKVWDATANMERYVQYGFTPNERHKIFGSEDWGKFIPRDFDELAGFIRLTDSDKSKVNDINEAPRTFQHILDTPPTYGAAVDSATSSERFNSVINFSNFLLHVLRVWSGENIPLDDKQLLDQFDSHILRIKKNQVEATQGFIFALLRCKYLFDQYIVKREMSQEDSKWSLKRLHYSSSNSQGYIGTFGSDDVDVVNLRILMLLSAFHVSTPTLVYKHWLNGALYQLYQMKEIRAQDYLESLEHLARQFVYGRFLSQDDADYYDMIYQGCSYTALSMDQVKVNQRLTFGKIENNFVFNYLDYLLWCDGVESKSKDGVMNSFRFSFRSSVEHFYPQHPKDGYRYLDEKDLNRFGNLCLLSHSKNSKLSNFQPKSKREEFQAAIGENKIDTLKLYEMIKLLNSSDEWGESQIEQHEEEMFRLFELDMQRGLH
ncbi:DUF262 domain-containing HNH endonuclease family protein [Thalassolituus sp.]|jgi:hypothetical protein|uniref:DUF262 domain-containing protein n=1 Tax=Thalassolituus sp. TaxID=2030822 RepID=UPI0032D96C26